MSGESSDFIHKNIEKLVFSRTFDAKPQKSHFTLIIILLFRIGRYGNFVKIWQGHFSLFLTFYAFFSQKNRRLCIVNNFRRDNGRRWSKRRMKIRNASKVFSLFRRSFPSFTIDSEWSYSNKNSLRERAKLAKTMMKSD